MQQEPKVNILLVDDCLENLQVLEDLLENLEQNLVMATSGEEALRCLQCQDFAVILLDIHMPVMDGFETAKLIRQRERTQHTPIIFITALYRRPTAISKAYSLGVVDYIVKPLEPEILLAKVAAFVALFQKTEEVKRQAAELEAANKTLQVEIAHRRQAESALRRAHDELEIRVEERTAELVRTNERLQAEIEERKRVEEALKLAQFSVDRAVDTISWIGRDGRFMYVNDALCRSLGYEREELLSMRVPDINPDVTEEIWPQIWQALEQQGSLLFESRHRRKDGRIFPVEITANYLKFNGKEYSFCFARDITRRKQAEEALRESEQQLHAILDNSPAVIYLKDTEGRFIFVNRQFEILCNITRERALGKTDWEIFPKDAADRFVSNDKRVLAAGTPLEFEEVVPKPDGERTCISQKFPLYNSAGIPYAVCGISTDITPRKRAEEAMRISEERFRIALGNSPTMVFNQDTDLRYTWIYNPTPALAPEDVLGKLDSDILSPEDVERLTDIKRRVLATGVGTRQETFITVSGEVRHYDLTVEPLRRPDGEIVGITCAATDITYRVKAEKALEESQRFIQKIADTTPNMIYVFDLAQMRNTYLNRNARNFLGKSLEEMQAMGAQFFAEILHPDDVYKFAELLNESLAKAKIGEILENEFRMKNAGGDWRWLHTWDVVFTRNAEGVPQQMLGTAADITDLKRAEEMRLALETEKELGQLQRRFFAMVSHEFRTPISTILLSAQSLEHSWERWTKEKVFKNLHRIQAGCKQMTHLLEDIMTINRAETGKLEVNLRELDLESFCYQQLEEIQLIDSQQHVFTFSSQGSPQEALADERLLRSILNNLLSNAIKYTPEGGKVDFSLVCEGGEAIFRICDEGIGIPPEDQRQLFEAFHRGQNVGHIPGTGLGLTVVRKCVELHGGSVTVWSEVGAGTAVTVRIPLDRC